MSSLARKYFMALQVAGNLILPFEIFSLDQIQQRGLQIPHDKCISVLTNNGYFTKYVCVMYVYAY